MNRLAKLLFKYRSYTPLPFVLVMLYFYDGTLLSWIIGGAVSLTGELLRIWGVAYAGSITRTTTSVKANNLVTSGPFAHVRNPLYIGNILIYLGFGIISLALFPYLQIFALVWFVFQYVLIIKIEEEFLMSKFGEVYTDYKNKVPRIIPNLSSLKVNSELYISPNYKKALKSETNTIQAMVSIPIILFIIHMVK